MPELPEVRAHAERLDAELRGVVLNGFRPLSFTALKTAVPRPDECVGQPVERVYQRGKLVLVAFRPATFVVHLMQGGRLRPDPKRAPKVRGGLARWVFADGQAWLLTEAGTEHKAGVWVLAGDPASQPPLAALGPDADTVAPDQLALIVRSTSMRLHTFLRDQHHVSGLGRRLANEICHLARLSPFSATARLDDDAIVRLHGAIASGVAEGLAFERARDDMSSSKDRPGVVHGRTGQPCSTCGDVVRAVEYSAYTVNYCAMCQTDGKVLADNTTSKFLR